MTTDGEELIKRCKERIIATLHTPSECNPTGQGLRSWKFRAAAFRRYWGENREVS